jgi:hypothetical protein
MGTVAVFRFDRKYGWEEDLIGLEDLVEAVETGWVYRGAVLDVPSVAYEGLVVSLGPGMHKLISRDGKVCCTGETTGTDYQVNLSEHTYTVRLSTQASTACQHEWADTGFKWTFCKCCNATGTTELGHVRVA